MSLSPAFIWNAVSIALGVIGGVVFLWAMFWDRARGRLRCPKCWYDMKGAVEAKAEGPWTCSECGKVSRTKRRLRKARRRPWTAMFAAVSILLALYVWSARDRVLARGWIGAVPTTALVVVPGLHDEHTLPGVWSDWSAWPAPMAPPTWRDKVRRERTARLDARAIGPIQSRLWARTIVRDLGRVGIVPLDMSRGVPPRPMRVGERVVAAAPVVASIDIRTLVKRTRSISMGWSPEQRRLTIEGLLESVSSGASLVADFRLDRDSGHWSQHSPSALCVDLHHVLLCVGPPDSVMRAKVCADLLLSASSTRAAVPEDSLADLAVADSFRNLAMPHMNASPTLDELCRVIEEVSGRRVFLDPTLVDTGAKVDLSPQATVSEACDALVAALSDPSSLDRIHWTHSSAGIEVGNRRALFHCVAPRVYTLKPLLVEDGNGLTRDDLGRAGAVQPTLDELIRRAADEGWIDNGANIRAVGSLFVVNSTPAVHARVARFLMDYAAPERESVPPARPQPGSGG